MATKTIELSELRRDLKRERDRLRQCRRDDYKQKRVNYSAETHDALSRVLLLEDLIEGTLELEG